MNYKTLPSKHKARKKKTALDVMMGMKYKWWNKTRPSIPQMIKR